MSDMLNLEGEWQLTFFREGKLCLNHPDELSHVKNAETISAAVPGNLELDLWRANKIDDPYVGMNAKKLREYEFHEWWLQRDFKLDAAPAGRTELVFEGLDCFATIWLNGQCIGQTDNALIPHVFDVTDVLQVGKNHIVVRIGSVNNAARQHPVDASAYSAFPYNYEALRVRKPAHAWGWDITPRMMLGGIWRPVYLRAVPSARFTENHIQIMPSSNANRARLLVHYNFETDDTTLFDYRLKISGRCGDSHFEDERAVWATGGAWRVAVEKPQRWWPRGYGEPNLYDVKFELFRGKELVAVEHRTLGIRTVRLQMNPIATDGPEPDFQFFINDVPIMVKGTNWVPADALHGRDTERIPAIMELVEDLDCNMLRVWGGGVYEPHLFYDLCDRKGIMVWQDFMMACMNYPQDEAFQKTLAVEAEAAVKRLRRYASIVVWAGDNECDMVSSWLGMPVDPNDNILTRKILPEVIRRHDPFRPYLPSSPYLTPEAFAAAKRNTTSITHFCPEQHRWGPRDYHKSDFYKSSKASFLGEIGYHGLPGVGSIKKFITPKYHWPYYDNPEWDFHASNPFHGDNNNLNGRNTLTINNIREFFGAIPETLEEVVIASQICQAEALKFFIERTRGSNKMTGILWWNLIECWPQFASTAVVDYYFNRKLAYYFIRRSQQPVLVMLAEPKAWNHQVIVANDSRRPVSGRFKIWDVDSDDVLIEEAFNMEADTTGDVATLPAFAGEKRLLLIRWELADGTVGVNHYICGSPAFDFEQYRQNWLPKLAELDQSFDAGIIGQ